MPVAINALPANSIHWVWELLLHTVGSSYPAIADHFLAGDKASGHYIRKSVEVGLQGVSLLYILPCAETQM